MIVPDDSSDQPGMGWNRCYSSSVGGCLSVLLDASVATTADADSDLTSNEP